MKPTRALSRLCCFWLALSLLGAADFDPARYLDHIKFLASVELKGRGTGTPELDKAADYIAAQFRAAGLKPPADPNFFQTFPVTANARLGIGNRFEYAAGPRKKALAFQDDFLPLNFSAAGAVAGGLVFAGYGITAPEYHYDDYAGLDVRDKLVLLLRHEPQEFDEKSVFAGRLFTEHAQFWSKAVNAKLHGARGVILVADRANHRGEPDELEKFGRAAGPVDAGIIFVQVKAAIADAWFELAGRSLDDLQQAIDNDLKPRSFSFPDTLRVSVSADLLREVRDVRNVAAYLEGHSPEYVIIGAHYDHLGLGQQSSLAPSQVGSPHPGADDNASGVAGLIELARWFASRGKPRRGILFLAFAAEEIGLLGSSFWANHPQLPLAQAVAMINLDMIGRPRDGRIYIGGLGTGTTLKALVEQSVVHYKLKPDLSGTSEIGSSDHSSFTSKQVPALFFFSGLHADYHKPSDTWDKIDAPAAVEVLRAVADLTQRLIDAPERPQFVRSAAPRPVGRVGGQGAARPWFGSVPDFADNPQGLRFADVLAGSPAAKAGLRTGDILVQFAGKSIQNLYDFQYALSAHKPGDVVPVKVLRDGKPLEVQVTLTPR